MQSKMVWIDVDDNLLKLYENNPRHNELAIDSVAISIEKFGFKQPLVLSKDGTVIVGHTRLLAAVKLGLKKVPVIYSDLSEEDEKAYRIADNRVSENSRWDYELLNFEISDLNDMNYDLSVLGFSGSEISKSLTGWESDISMSKIEEDDSPVPSMVKIFCKEKDKDEIKTQVKDILDGFDVRIE